MLFLVHKFVVMATVNSMAIISHLVKVADCLAVIADITSPVIVRVSLLRVRHHRTVVYCVDHT